MSMNLQQCDTFIFQQRHLFPEIKGFIIRQLRLITRYIELSCDLVQPGPCSSSRLEMAAKRKLLVQSGFGKKMALRLPFYLFRQIYSAITNQNINDTYLIMRDSQSTSNYLAI